GWWGERGAHPLCRRRGTGCDSAPQPGHRRRSGRGRARPVRPHEQVPDLAVQRPADRDEGGEADGPRTVVLQHREVDDAHPDELAEPRERHAPLGEQLVEPAVDAGGCVVVGLPRPRAGHHTSPSTSRCIRVPIPKAAATTPRARPMPMGARSRVTRSPTNPSALSPERATACGAASATTVPRPKSASTPLVVPPTMTRTATQLSAVVTERPKGRCREIRTHSHTRATQMPSMVSQARSEEHTSELQSRENLVCRLLLETKNA